MATTTAGRAGASLLAGDNLLPPGDTALAVLTCAMMGKRFTDFLSFTRIDGEWRIAAKVFHYDLISEE